MKIIRPSLLMHLGIALAVGSLAFSRVARHSGRLPPPSDVDFAAGEAAEFADGAVLVLKDFSVPRWPGGKPRQYVSKVHVISPDAQDGAPPRVEQAEISVNHPLRVRGWWIYQYSWGEAPDGRLFTVLRFLRDPTLPWAAAGGILLLAGSFWFMIRSFRGRVAVPGCGFSHEEPALALWRRALPFAAAAALSLLPAYFIGRSVLKEELVPALQSPLLFPHILAYLGAYVIMLFAAFGHLRKALPAAFFLMTLGLALGALWGKICWSEWWQFDPKEMWSFATWIVYAAAFHVKYLAKNRPWRLRAERIALAIGAVLVVLTLTWVNFSRIFAGVHSYL